MLYVHEVCLLILLFCVELYYKMFVNAKSSLNRVESP